MRTEIHSPHDRFLAKTLPELFVPDRSTWQVLNARVNHWLNQHEALRYLGFVSLFVCMPLIFIHIFKTAA